MNLTIDSNIKNIVFRLGGIDYPVSKLRLSKNGAEAVDIWEEQTEIDYTKEYFQVISWEDNCTFTFTNPKGFTLYYSIDKSTWSSTSNSSMTYSLSKGQRLYFKGSWSNSALAYNNNDSYSTKFDCDKLFEVAGNLCSLFYSDNFEGKTDYNGCYWMRIIGYQYILSMRNLILPSTNYSTNYNYRGFAGWMPNLIYNIKELPANTTSVGTWPITSFNESSPKIQESPVIRFNSTDCYQAFAGSSLKRLIWLGASGYPSNYGSVPSGLIKYKLSTNSASGTYRDFDTLLENNQFISIWAEAEIPYTGYVEGCSDYFIAGDTVELKATGLNGCTFTGYYDGDTLVSSSSTYTFTASANMKLKVKFEEPKQCVVTTNVNDAQYGSASGGGTYYSGDSVTVTANPSSGYTLEGWYISGNKVSSSQNYTFTVIDDTTITAVFEVNLNPYTPVSYIKTTSTSGTTAYYFDTGITAPAYGTAELHIQFMPLTNNGDVFYGHMGGGYDWSDDSRDFRIFWYNNEVYCDVGSYRATNRSNASFNELKDWVWKIDYDMFYEYYIKNNTNNVTFLYGDAYDGNVNPYNIYINLSPQKFKSLVIKKNNVEVFNGIAAIDNNNVPCIYDSVSNSLKYNIGSGANSGLTFEA